VRQSGVRVIHAATADETRALGARLARALRTAPLDQSFFITLSGDLGAGKTTLVGGLLAVLGHAGPARSPTYTLIEPYELAGRDVLHCDLYRLRHPDELDDLGLHDLARPGSVLLVEWPERAEGRLGEPDLVLRLTYDGAGRACEIEARTPTGQALAGQLSGQT
jgi:tRNA threonylcarbamoyladenosine biosynthesis protein TsaE